MDCCPSKKNDYFFIALILVIVPSYLLAAFSFTEIHFFHAVFEFLNTMWPGILAGIFFVGILHYVPQHLIFKILGTGGFLGVVRAAFAGIIFDLCSHGILMIASKLYKKGLSTGQVMAFLIASPWNSLSLTLILFTLIGIKWTLIFMLLSTIIAIITGVIFDLLIKYKKLPDNPFKFGKDEEIIRIEKFQIFKAIKIGVLESKIILKWLFLGVILVSLIREFVTPELFATLFGPTIKGLFLTLFVTSIIEVCSEGSAPIASDIFNLTNAKGNAFTFLMAGVATDYTEIAIIKDVTKSLKLALFIPLITVPQTLLIGYFLNF